MGIVVDGIGNVYVTDPAGQMVQKFTGDGAFLTRWAVTGTGGTRSWPYAIAVDHRGDIYVSDPWGSEVLKFAGDGSSLSRWSQLEPESSAPPRNIQKMSHEGRLSGRIQHRIPPPLVFRTPVL